MRDEEISEVLVGGAPCCAASEAERRVPPSPGFYAISVDSADALPQPFADLLRARGTRLVYIGIATTSLRERLVEQDLRHQRPSTFFRGIGSVLGFKPPAGSLLGNKNQNNYKFSPPDTTAIIEWITKHIAVRWLESNSTAGAAEAFAIRRYRPLLNTTHNPEPVPELATLRAECRRIATSAGPKRAT